MTIIDDAAKALEEWVGKYPRGERITADRIRMNLFPLLLQEMDERLVRVEKVYPAHIDALRSGNKETYPRSTRLLVEGVAAVNQAIKELEFRLYLHGNQEFECGMPNAPYYCIDGQLVRKDDPHNSELIQSETEQCSSFCTATDELLELATIAES